MPLSHAFSADSPPFSQHFDNVTMTIFSRFPLISPGFLLVSPGPGHMGLAATMWVPMMLEYPYCHQMMTQTHPTAYRRVQDKFLLTKIFKCHRTTDEKLPKRPKPSPPIQLFHCSVRQWVCFSLVSDVALALATTQPSVDVGGRGRASRGGVGWGGVGWGGVGWGGVGWGGVGWGGRRRVVAWHGLTWLVPCSDLRALRLSPLAWSAPGGSLRPVQERRGGTGCRVVVAWVFPLCLQGLVASTIITSNIYILL